MQDGCRWAAWCRMGARNGRRAQGGAGWGKDDAGCRDGHMEGMWGAGWEDGCTEEVQGAGWVQGVRGGCTEGVQEGCRVGARRRSRTHQGQAGG